VSAIDAGSSKPLLAMLAPLVMRMLGKNQRQQGLNIGGLTDLLGGERKAAEKKASGAADLLGSLLGGIFGGK
jgi:hypothetical protein